MTTDSVSDQSVLWLSTILESFTLATVSQTQIHTQLFSSQCIRHKRTHKLSHPHWKSHIHPPISSAASRPHTPSFTVCSRHCRWRRRSLQQQWPIRLAFCISSISSTSSSGSIPESAREAAVTHASDRTLSKRKKGEATWQRRRGGRRAKPHLGPCCLTNVNPC